MIEKPNFLIGNWQRLEEKEGKQTYEYWDADFKGLGFTLHNKDITFKEILSIQETNDTLRWMWKESMRNRHILHLPKKQIRLLYVKI